MPWLVRLYIRQCLLGLALEIGFSMLIVAFNVANLGWLVSTVSGGWLAFALLSVFNGLVFAGVLFGVTIMRLGRDEADK